MITESPVRAVERCLGCGSTALEPVLDLGCQPLANRFTRPDPLGADEPAFPLGIQACPDCCLVQLTHVVDPAVLFSAYLYVPSASSTWVAHCAELAAYVCAEARLQPGDFVVEIGSNDGTLLRAFQTRGLRVLGVDPAANIAALANAAGIPTLNRFFGVATAEEVLAEHGPASAVVSTNVLAHVPDPVAVLRGVRGLLRPGGLYVNESPSLGDLVRHTEFDTIYHEHVSYFSLQALANLLARADLRLVDAVPQAVHGGSLRIVGVPSTSPRPASAGLRQLLAEEQVALRGDRRALRDFARRTAAVRERLRALLARLRADGKRVAAYGATAKGNTLLGYCGLTAADIAYIVDRNPLKQGLLAPGSRIPVVPPERLTTDPPDVLLLLAWNLADEIRQQLAWFAERGGAFLLPIPEPRLV